jgi:hypothetical protein
MSAMSDDASPPSAGTPQSMRCAPMELVVETVRVPQSAVILRKVSQISLVAASSLGKCPRVLMILRS